MADLDDFFAKKDKRGKNKKKTTTTEVLEKKLEEVTKASQRASTRNPEDDEWNTFQNDEKDYTGLKIQLLSLEEEQAQREAHEEAKKAAEQNQKATWDQEEADRAMQAAAVAQQKSNKNQDDNDDRPEFMKAFRRKQQVRLDDVIEFPSLGTSLEAYEEPQGFQTVRTGQSTLNPNQASARDNIRTANKFNALGE